MNRKEAIKGLVAIGIIATIPSLVKLTNKGKSIHFIGLGGAGSKAMGHIYKQGIPTSYTYITDVEHFKSNSKIKFISYTHSKGKSSQIGKNPYSEAEMLEKLVLPSELNELFNENDTYILLAGLGGSTGAKVPIIDLLVRENKRDFHAILSLPFKFESRRRNYAQKMIEKYQKFPNVYFFDNEEIKEIGGNKHIAETLVSSDNEFYKIVKEKVIV